jgi:hypothetical protein
VHTVATVPEKVTAPAQVLRPIRKGILTQLRLSPQRCLQDNGATTGCLLRSFHLTNFHSCMYSWLFRLSCIPSNEGSRYSDGLWGGRPVFDSRQCKILLFSTASKRTLGLTQPPIQWVPGTLSAGLKRQGHEADHSLHVASRSREAKLYLHSRRCLYSVVLN